MSSESENKRIDLTQFEGIGVWEVVERPKEHADDETKYDIKTGRHNASLSEAETIAKLPNLIAELKRCYETIDFLTANCTDDEDWWAATCEPEGRGPCRLEIESWQELMRLEKSNKIEIPDYSHDGSELLLYDCDCENGRPDASE
jgi:hypothetical protein